MSDPNVRDFQVHARSTDLFGRVLCGCRNQHFVIDGPVQNGCPGEAITPVESFLAGVAACGVELLQVIARERDLPLRSVRVEIAGTIDRGRPARSDFSVFNSVRLDLRLAGVGREEAEGLIAGFRKR
jgi:uncharacterized OsmC-like protein